MADPETRGSLCPDSNPLAETVVCNSLLHDWIVRRRLRVQETLFAQADAPLFAINWGIQLAEEASHPSAQ
jgi:hypothetical protein